MGPPGAVGTEAVAKRNLELNRVDFRYPISGFEHQIEHTLIYNMLSSPEIYPDSAIRTAIREEDFDQYMLVADSTRNKKEGDEDEHLYSYSQLSALLALAAEKWPGEQNELNDGNKDESIPQILCRTLLRNVVRHAEEHELDRESEVQELLEPLKRLTAKKDAQNAGALLIPMYIGFGASVVTGNPLPMYLGWAAGSALTMQDPEKQQNQANNLQQLTSTTDRVADVEKTSLLDESDDTHDYF